MPAGVRRAAGNHAKILNMIVEAWEEKDPVQNAEKLKEILGHTPLQVAAGAFLGIIYSVIVAAIIGF